MGVEAYGAYGLRAWHTPGISALARKYAARSAVGSLGLGMAGQVIYVHGEGLLGDACLRATTLPAAGAGFRRSAPAAVFLLGAGP